MDKPKLMIIIVDREIVDKVAENVAARGASVCNICYGKGTAKSNLLHILGLGDTQKGVVFCSVKESDVEAVFTTLRNEYDFEKPGKGIAFTVPMTSVGGPATLKMLLG